MRRVVDAVGIALAARIKTRMEIGWDRVSLQHADIGRKQRVEREGILVGGNAAQGIKVGTLAQGMHARIGAAGARHTRLFPGQAGERLLQHLLHAQGIVLPLPARIGGAVVADGQQHAVRPCRRTLFDDGRQLAHFSHIPAKIVTSSVPTVASSAHRSLCV